eukprot:7907399-Pyramimonas_sp.AAC.1
MPLSACKGCRAGKRGSNGIDVRRLAKRISRLLMASLRVPPSPLSKLDARTGSYAIGIRWGVCQPRVAMRRVPG